MDGWSPNQSLLRLCRGLDDVILVLLRELLAKYLAPKKLRQVVNKKKIQLSYSQQHVVNEGKIPDYSHFDLPFVCFLLRHACEKIVPPSHGWGTPPKQDTEVTIGDDLERIRKVTTLVYHYLDSEEMATRKAQRAWKTLADVVGRLETQFKKSDFLERWTALEQVAMDTVEEEEHVRTLKEWRENDTDSTYHDHEPEVTEPEPRKTKKGADHIPKNTCSKLGILSRYKNNPDSIQYRMTVMMQSLIKGDDSSKAKSSGNRNIQELSKTEIKMMTSIHQTTLSLLEEFSTRTLPIFSHTNATKTAGKVLTEEGLVFLTGLPGEGKSTLGMYLLQSTFEHDMEVPIRLMLDSPDQFCNVIDPAKKYVVLLDDMFGCFQINYFFLQKWCKLFELMFKLIKTERVRFILTCRDFIYAEIWNIPEMQKFIKKRLVVSMSSKMYSPTQNERISMIEKLVAAKKINISVDQRHIITKSNPHNLGFPLCLQLFYQQKQLKTAFKTPRHVILEEIDNLYTTNHTKYIALSLVLFKNCEQSTERKFKEQTSLHSNLQAIFENTVVNPKQFGDALNNMEGIYIIFSKTFQCHQFFHPIIIEAMVLSLSKRYPKVLIAHCPISLMCMLSITVSKPSEIELNTKCDQEVIVQFSSHLQPLFLTRITPLLEMKVHRYFENVCCIKKWQLEDANLFQDIFFAKDIDDRSLLYYAVKVNNFDLVQVMLENVPVRSDEMAADIYQGLLEAAMAANTRLYFILLSEWKEKLKQDVAFAAASGGNIDIFQNTMKEIKMNVINESQETLLIMAARRGHFDCVKLMLNKHLELLLKASKINGSILHAMVEGQNEDVVNLITKRIVDDLTAEEMQNLFKTKNENGETVFHILMKEQNYNITFLLIETIDYTFLQLKNKKGENALHFAALHGQLDVVKHIVLNYPEIIQSMDELGGTALHHAAAGGNVRVFNELLKAGISPYSTTSDGNTVLHLAAYNRNEELVRFIVRSTPDILLRVNSKKWTALHSAAAGGSVDVLAELLHTNISTSSVTLNGNTVLHLAAINRHEDLAKYIIKHIPDTLHLTNNAGQSALHSAAIGGDSFVFDSLQVAGLNPKSTTKMGMSVLHVATHNGNTELVQYLIEKFSDVVKLSDSSHRNALHYAAAGGDEHMFHDLTKAGLKVEVSRDGTTVMHIAAFNGKIQLCRHIKRNYNEIVGIPDDNDRSALHAASAGGNITVFSELVRSNLSPRAKTKDGMSVLHIAAYQGCLELIIEILGKYPDVLKLEDNFGNTALHYAVVGGHVSVCEALVNAGLSALSLTMHGESLLHLAVSNNKTEVVTYLTSNIPEIVPQCNKVGESPLHYASAAGTVYAFHKLVEADISPESLALDGTSVLHVAAYCGNIELVRHIISHTKSLGTVRDDRQWTALHFAAAGGSVEVFSELIRDGLSPKLTTSEESTVLHIAAFNSQKDIVQYIHTNIPNIVQVLDNQGWNALHAAAAVGEVDTFEDVLASGVPVDSLTRGNSTVLHIAAYHGNVLLAKHIIKKYPLVLKFHDSFGRSALHDAAAGGNLELFKHFISNGLSLTEFQKDGSTVLHIAVANKNVELSKYIMGNHAGLVCMQDNYERTALHASAVGGSVELFKKLSHVSGLKPTTVTNTGCTVLHIASESGSVDLVKFIIASVQVIVNAEDDDGKTAIHYAAAGGSSDVFDALLNAGLFPEPSPIDGTTILHVAAVNKYLDLVRYIVNKLPDMVHITDKNGWTALHYAAAGGDINIFFVLVKAGLALAHRANDGSTVLHKAAYCGNIDLVKYIIEIVPELLQLKDDSAWTPLHSAAAGGNVEVFQEILSYGIPPNAMAVGGNTVLHIAVYNGQTEIVKYIIHNIPDIVPIIDDVGKNSLHYAAAGGNIAVFNELVHAGVSVLAKTKDGSTLAHIAASNSREDLIKYIATNVRTILPLKDNSGWTSLHSAAAIGNICIAQELIDAGILPSERCSLGRTFLHVAAFKGKIAFVRYVIKHFEDVLNLKDDDGNTALHSAAAGGSIGVFIELLHAELPPDDITKEGNSVLHIAANNGKIDLVRYLVRFAPSVVHLTNIAGKTALHSSIASKTSRVFFELLNSGVSPDIKAKSGKTILHEAAFCGKLDILKHILKHFSHLKKETDESGRNALHYAAAGGSVEVFVELVKAKLSVNATPNDGSTVLHIASFNGQLELVTYILDNFPSTIPVVDNSGKTALHHAAAGGSVEVFSELLQAGLSPKTTTSDGSTVLHIAAFNGRMSIVNLIIHALNEILTLPDSNGRTALHYAAAGGHVDVFVALIEAGLKPYSRTAGGSTVLHLAAANSRLTLVKHILQSNENYIFSIDEQGRSALHLAALKNLREIFDLLVDSGLSPLLTDRSGNTPLDLASNLLKQHVVRNYPEIQLSFQLLDENNEDEVVERKEAGSQMEKSNGIDNKVKMNGHAVKEQNKKEGSKACTIQ